MSSIAKKLAHLFDEASAHRSSFTSHWQDLAKVLSPSDEVFTVAPNKSMTMNKNVYDTTGIHSNELLSSGFFSLLTSPTVPWFVLKTDNNRLNETYEVKRWLAEVSHILAYEIQRPQTGFTTAMHEFYLEYGAYGNGTMFVSEKSDLSSLLFTTIPLAECYYIESDQGQVDTLIRHYYRTALQLVERFGINNVSEEVQNAIEKNQFTQQFEILHFIIPSYLINGISDFKPSLPYVSVYIERKMLSQYREVPESFKPLSINGFNEKPFMAARFYKLSQEIYGRGPGTTALADLNMLQEMAKTTLRGAQKMVDPPLQMPDQGFLKPPNTAPGRMNYYRQGGQDRIEPILTGGRPDLGMDLIMSYQNRVREIFFVDQLQLNIGPQMTATEVIQRTEEKQRLMGPVIGRASTELLSPLIARAFGLLGRAGKLPEPPQAFQQRDNKLRIIYTSPIFKAQEQVGANNIMRAMQVLMPIQATDPTVMDTFHPQRTAQGVADLYNIDPKYLRTDDELQALQQQRQESAAQAAQAEQMKNAGIGINNLASAGETLGGMM